MNNVDSFLQTGYELSNITISALGCTIFKRNIFLNKYKYVM